MNTAARMALATSSGWVKSTFSGGQNGCVAVNRDVPGVVGVRDTKLGESSPILVFDVLQWQDWLDEVTSDRLTNTNGAATVAVRAQAWEVRPVDGGTETLRFDRVEWEAFRAGARAGEFS